MRFVLAITPLFYASGSVTSSNIASLFAGLVLLFSSATFSSAVLMRAMPIEELETRSQIIVHGTVLSKTTTREPDGQLMTRVEVKVLEHLKGNSKSARFVIAQLGGVLGDEITEVSGQEHYEIGEEVVTFLVLNSRGEGVTLGLAQGKFHVSSDPLEKVVQNPFHGGGKAGQKRLTLDSLKQKVKARRS